MARCHRARGDCRSDLPFFPKSPPGSLLERPGAFLVPAIVAAHPIAVEYALAGITCSSDWKRRVLTSSCLRHLLAERWSTNPHPTAGGGASGSFVSRRCRYRVHGRGRPGCTVRGRATDATGNRDFSAPSSPRTTRPWQDQRPGSAVATVPWVRVYDGRPESVLRRASGRPTEQLARARILLLGCGGLGAPIAEHCARSGVARLHIVDSGTVSPGCPVPTALRRRGHRQAEGDGPGRPARRPAARTARSPRQSTTQPRPTCSACLNWPTTT